MATPPSTPPRDPGEKSVGELVFEVSERTSTLVREEIELAKAEITRKATTLGKGLGVAIAAGVFGFFGLIFFLHFLAWLLYDLFFDSVFWGYLIVTILLFALAAVAGLIGLRWIKRGAPPTPDMAIEEARLIKETVKD